MRLSCTAVAASKVNAYVHNAGAHLYGIRSDLLRQATRRGSSLQRRHPSAPRSRRHLRGEGLRIHAVAHLKILYRANGSEGLRQISIWCSQESPARESQACCTASSGAGRSPAQHKNEGGGCKPTCHSSFHHLATMFSV